MLIILHHYQMVFIFLKRVTSLVVSQSLLVFVIGAAQQVTGAVGAWCHSQSALQAKTYLWGLLLLGWKSIYPTVFACIILPC